MFGEPQSAKELCLKDKLLVLTSTYPRWSQDTEPAFVHELSRRLADDYEVHVLAPHTAAAKTSEIMDSVHVHRFRYAPTRFEQLAYEGGISERLRHKQWRLLLVPFLLIAQITATWRFMRKHRPDMIHAHWIFPQAFIAVLANIILHKSVPILCTVHGADWYRLKGRFWTWVKAFTLKRCSVIAPVSEVLRQSIKDSGFATENLSKPMPMGIRQPDGMPDWAGRKPNSLLFVGRLVPKKGVDVLLEAAGLLNEKGVQFHLTIAGGGESYGVYEARLMTLGIRGVVSFLGAIPHKEVYAQMGNHQICIVPSLEAEDGDQEGLGLTVLEALACGSHVVASDISVFRDLLGNEDVSHRFFKAGDAVDLSKCLEQKLSRAEYAAIAQHRQVHMYSWPVITNRYKDVFRRLLTNES